jgi:CRP-like cAMP-binding protein
MLNVVIMAWIIGSITVIIVKKDKQTGLYHDTLQVLYKFSELHGFDDKTTKRLKTQLKLGFKNRGIADEQLLRFFPAAVRRKILRRLYMPSISSTNLMKGTRQQFVDSFLSLCSVEVFSPGEELLQRGSISADLYLLIDGTVEASKSTEDEMLIMDESDLNTVSQMPSLTDENSEIESSSGRFTGGRSIRKSGDFLNELCELPWLLFDDTRYFVSPSTHCLSYAFILTSGFFTESPESDTIRTRTACQVLVMSRSHYKGIAADHPGSAGVVLRNLLDKYGERRKDLSLMRSSAQNRGNTRLVSWDADVDDTQDRVHKEKTVAAIRELIEMHINKQKDEHTTWFCFAASRGDTATISMMCDQGFDPNSSDCEHSEHLILFFTVFLGDSSPRSAYIFHLLSRCLQMTSALLSWSHP